MSRRLTVLSSRRAVIAFALFAALLVVTAIPAAAISVPTSTVEGGSHTTDTDFQNATTTNMTVSGSGTSASVVASSGGTNVDLSGTNVTGASETYQLGDYDTSTTPTLELTGQLSTEWDNETGSGTLPSSISVGGNQATTGNLTIQGGKLGYKTNVSSTTLGRAEDVDISTDGNYAYVTANNYDGVAVVDISDPANPTITGSVSETATANAQSIVTGPGGSYAYLVTDNDRFAAIEVSDPANPTVADYLTENTKINGGGGVDIAPGGNYAYALGRLDDYFTVIDISDPTALSIVGSVSDGTDLDSGRGDTVVAGAGGDYAYVAASDSDTVTVVDVSTKTSPSVTGSVTDSTNLDGAQGIDVGSNGNYVHVSATNANRTTVVNVTDKPSPTIEGTIQNDSMLNEPRNLYLGPNNDTAYVAASGSNSVAKVDISNPALPSITESVSTPKISGAFSAVADSSAEYIYVAAETADALAVLDNDTPIAGDVTIDGETHSLDTSAINTAEYDLSTGTLTVSDTLSGSLSSYTLTMQERSQTENPGVGLNGDNQSYTGTLNESETTSFTWDTSNLNPNGDNTVNVTLPDLSADAPPMTVDYQYTHTTSKSWASAEYLSAPYDLANVTEMSIDVEMRNSEGTFAIEKYTGSSWETVTSTSITANGTHTLNPSRISDSNEVRASVTFDRTASDNYAELKSDTAFFLAHGSSVDGQSRSTNNEDVTVSATIDDAEFDDPQGDSVTAEIYWQGSLVKTVSDITSETTVSYSTTNLSDGDYNWHVETTDSYGVTHTSETYTLTVNHYAPNIDDASASPTGPTSYPDQNYTIDITDRDMTEPSGDTLTASLEIDGSEVGTDTLTSNGTASVEYTIPTSGDHTYQWVVTDEYGQTSQSQTFTISTPDELRVYNESNPDELLTNATVELRFFANETGAETIVTRNTTNGVIDLTGLPINEPLIAVAEAENFTNRRIFIGSVYEQSNLFLLPESVTKTTTIFRLEDYTGDFPAENSALKIQRSLNDSYQTVLGDFFGATDEFSAQMEYEVRHRMVLINVETGKTRTLGTFTPVTDSTQTLAITPPNEDIEAQGVQAMISPQTSRIPAVSDALIEASVIGQNQNIDSWSVTAELRNETSTQEIWNFTSSTGGTKNTTLDLGGQSGKNLTVTLTYQAGGMIISEQRVIQIDKRYNPDSTLLGALGSLIGLSPDSAQSGLTTLLAMFLSIFMIGSAARIQPSGELAGLVGVAMLTGFAAIGWVGWGLVFVSGVGLVSFAGIRRGI